MTSKIEILLSNSDHLRWQFWPIVWSKTVFLAIIILENFEFKYSNSLLPISDSLLWGPADTLQSKNYKLKNKFYIPKKIKREYPTPPATYLTITPNIVGVVVT